MISSELLRIRHATVGKVLLGIVLAEAVLIGLLMVFLPNFIDGLIGLNEVIPNATNAEQFTDEQLTGLTLASPDIQLLVGDVLGNTGLGISLPVVAATLFGALTITGEFRRGSMTNSVLVDPRRVHLILRKLATLISFTTAAAVVLILVRMMILTIGLAVQEEPLLAELPELLAMCGRGIIALVLYTTLGFGIGLLVRSQVATLAAVFTAIVVESVIRPLALLILGGANPTLYLPFGLVPDLSDTTPLAALGASAPLSATISPAAATVTLVLWALLLLGVATLRFIRTDVPAQA